MDTGKLSVETVPLDVPSLFGVRGKNVLVAVGGRGIGFMIAEGFARNGANVYLTSRSQKALQAAADHLNKKHAGIQGAGQAFGTFFFPFHFDSLPPSYHVHFSFAFAFAYGIALPEVDLGAGREACFKVAEFLEALGVKTLHVVVNNSGT